MEGGLTFGSASSHINQENVQATLDVFYKKYLPAIKMKKDNISPIGSTGKKGPGQSSGDIDIAIDTHQLIKNNPEIKTISDIFSFLENKTKKFTTYYHSNTGLGVFNFLWPIENIDGKQEGKLVQIDLMFSESLKFSQWAYHAPFWNQSKYKSKVRNELLRAVARMAYWKTIKKLPNGQEVEWEKYIISPNVGLIKIRQTNLGKKGNVVKNITKVSDELVTNDPETALTLVLGKFATLQDTDSFETVWKFINSSKYPYRNKIEEIKKMAIEFFKQAGVEPIPDELA